MQTTLELPAQIPEGAYEYGERASSEVHGVVLTKPHIVELILDLAGYGADQDLTNKRLLEPACGEGAFLTLAVERLLRSAGENGRDVNELRDAIKAYDIDANHVTISRRAVARLLRENGVETRKARALAGHWIQQGDFLLSEETRTFDAIVGNPPYVRIEQIHPCLQRIYRSEFSTLSDRADLYVAFVEKCLRLLGSRGILALICADRWTLNRYGAPLRRILAEQFKVLCYLDLHRASPFASEVIAYPSIFAIGQGRTDKVQVGHMETASENECQEFRQALRTSHRSNGANVDLSTYAAWFRGDEPWVISSAEHLETLRELEARFTPLEQCGGTRVGIGVATGNDKVYVVANDLDVESDRLVPLVMRGDLSGGEIHAPGHSVINPFSDRGTVVDLAEYPKLAGYLHEHSQAIKSRHVARKNPASWFRTIDRIYPELVKTPKLLIPDIAGANEVVFDGGQYYPHHNLYYVTSKTWDLEILGGLLSTRVALFFVWSYAVKMRGGYLRFQAQYLRRIRVPAPEQIHPDLAGKIRSAYRRRDFQRLDKLALEAYSLDHLPEFDFVDTRH